MPISNPQPNRSGAGWRTGQQHRVSTVVGSPTPSVASPTLVPLDAAGAQSSANLAVTAQTRIVLGAANAVLAASLAVTIYVPVVPGKFVLRNATVLVAGVDVSSQSRAVTFTQSREEIDITGYGDTYRVYLPGEASSTFVIEMFVDPVVLTPAVWSALEAGPVPVRVSSGPGAPTWIATACMVRESPLELQVGEAATATVELHSTGAVLQI